jgi:hypothetical protein
MLKSLTIDGETRSIKEWYEISRVVHYNTILKRVRDLKWPAKEAVFAPPLSQPQLRTRRRIPLRQSRPLQLPPATTQSTGSGSSPLAGPFRPTWGRIRSYPIESLELLRRMA